jgi:hypothetical protein
VSEKTKAPGFLGQGHSSAGDVTYRISEQIDSLFCPKDPLQKNVQLYAEKKYVALAETK